MSDDEQELERDLIKKLNDPSKSVLMATTPYGRPPTYAPAKPLPQPFPERTGGNRFPGDAGPGGTLVKNLKTGVKEVKADDPRHVQLLEEMRALATAKGIKWRHNDTISDIRCSIKFQEEFMATGGSTPKEKFFRPAKIPLEAEKKPSKEAGDAVVTVPASKLAVCRKFSSSNHRIDPSIRPHP